jgi:hypothetical protein
MNTLPKRRRHEHKYTPGNLAETSRTALGDIADPEMAALLGRIAARFTHLETALAAPLALLLGSDPDTAGYVLRSMRSANVRAELITALPQKARRNIGRGDAWDEVLGKFRKINQRRNAFVHAHWFTADDGSTSASFFDEHGLIQFSARKVEKSELETLLAEISVLHLELAVLPSWDTRDDEAVRVPSPKSGLARRRTLARGD